MIGSERGQEVLRRGQRGSEWIRGGGEGRWRWWEGERVGRNTESEGPEVARGGPGWPGVARGGQLLLFLVRDSEWRDVW